MADERFRTAQTWVVDFRYEGHPRRWFKVFRSGDDVPARMAAELQALYGDRATLVEVRKATQEEETQYLRGDEPKNMVCPTGRPARRDPEI